jgi:hypothetical protein
VRSRAVEIPMPALASEHKEQKKQKQVEPYRQWNEDCVGEAGSWKRGGEVRARTLGQLC